MGFLVRWCSLMILFCLIMYEQGKAQHSIPAEEKSLLIENAADSLGLEAIVKKIVSSASKPRLSLAYIALYESIVKENPQIPNRQDWVTELKGYRYNGLAWNANRTDSALAFKYLDTSQAFFDQLDFTEGTYQNLYGVGTIYKNAGAYAKALEAYDKYYQHHSDPFDSLYVANVQFQRAVVFLELGKLDEAIEAILHAVRLEEGNGRRGSQANNLNTLANIYKRAGMMDEAENAYEDAFLVFQQLDDSLGMTRVLINSGNFYSQTGKTEESKRSYYRAIPFAVVSEFATTYIYENLGNLYLLNETFDSSYHYLSRCYSLRKKIGFDKGIYRVEHKIGKLELRRKNYAEALPLLKRSFAFAQDINETEYVKLISEDLSQWYAERGKYKTALEYKDIYIEAKDSILNKDIAGQIAEINTKYETEKKEQEIALLSAQNEANTLRLQKERRTLYFSLAGLVLLGLLVFQMNRSRRKTDQLNTALAEKNAVVEASLREKEVLLKEIHHRVKNNLQVISSLLGIQSRNLSDPSAVDALNEGRSRVHTMSLIHQDLYQQDQLTGIGIKKYFGDLVENLFSTYNLSRDKITISTNIEDLHLDVDTVIPLGLIVNELITNALKYAFPNNHGHINIEIGEKNNRLSLKVTDNGQGIEDLEEMKNNESYGYELIEALVDKLDGTLEVFSDGGTQVNISFDEYQVAA